MSIGILQGTTDTNELIQVVFEAYYKAGVSLLESLGNTIISNITKTTYSYFNSSDNFKVLTLDNFQRGADGRWAKHEIIGANKPVLEFLGPGLEQISFSVFLSAGLGIKPETELAKLRKLRDGGVVCDFILGSKPITENSWVLKSLSEDHRIKDNEGQTVQAIVNVSLEEYVKEAEKESG